jgi:thiol-disulfide isomerase/thioredoxin
MESKRASRPHRTRLFAVAPTLALAMGLCVVSETGAQTPDARTSTPAAKADDPKARALFDEVRKAYQSLSSYSDNGRYVIAMTIDGATRKQETPMRLTLVRPNKFDFDTGAVRVVCDGTKLTTAAMPLKRVATEPAPQRIEFENFRQGPLGAVLFGGPARVPMFVLLNLLTAHDPAAAIAQLGGSLQFAPAALVPKEPNPPFGAKSESLALLIDMQDGPDVLLVVDPATKLVSGIEMTIDPASLAASVPAGKKVSVERFGWSAGAVSTQVAPDQPFSFVAPAGFTQVDATVPKRDEHRSDERVGKPAPDFTLTVLDGPGKTKRISKAELAGTVVLLDFWATWCAPCIKELPEIQKLIDMYAKSKKDVLIVALSQDDAPNEFEEVRRLVEKTLNEIKIKLADSPAGKIALDPSNSIGRAFDLGGLPTLVLIDSTGTIRWVQEGIDLSAGEPLHKTLADKIDALLHEEKADAPAAK